MNFERQNKVKVIFINNYPMDEAYEKWKKGIYPGHHLWGFLELRNDPDIEMIILKHQKFRFINQIGNLFDIGKLDQQLRAIWLLRRCDMIYSPYAAANTKLLIVLKWLGIIRKPIVIVIHQRLLKYDVENKFIRSILRKLILKYDSLIFLSDNLKQHLISTLNVPENIVKERYFDLNWGADEDFYRKYSKPKKAKETNCVVCAGHTGRDFESIIAAFRGLDFQLNIYCTPDSMPNVENLPENVMVTDANLTYKDLVMRFEDARFFLIPLKWGFKGTEGLTSILDILAMGKPVIMTRNVNMNLDVEKEGIGLYINEGTVEEWRNAITSILYNYELLDKMGERSYAIMKERYNLSLYAKGLRNIFLKTQEVYEKKQLHNTGLEIQPEN